MCVLRWVCCDGCVTDKEDVINIQALMRTKPTFCGHCHVVLINSGIRKHKSDLPPTLVPDDMVSHLVKYSHTHTHTHTHGESSLYIHPCMVSHLVQCTYTW